MGFGILFLSYIVAVMPDISSYTPFFRIGGGAGMMIAFWRLRQYDGKFWLPFGATGVYIAWSALWGGFAVPKILGVLGHDLLFTVFSLVSDVVLIAVIALILYSLRSISIGIERPDLSRKNTAALFFVGVWALFMSVFVLMQFGAIPQLRYFIGAYFILHFFVIGLTAVRILSSYRWICEEGDQDMPDRAPSDPIAKIFSRKNKK